MLMNAVIPPKNSNYKILWFILSREKIAGTGIYKNRHLCATAYREAFLLLCLNTS